jgi:inner membrane protein
VGAAGGGNDPGSGDREAGAPKASGWRAGGDLVLALRAHDPLAPAPRPLHDLRHGAARSFSYRRFAIDAIAIIDPVYSLALAIALVVGLARGVGTRPARVAAASALALSTAYLVYGLLLNHEAERLARAQLAEDGLRPERMNAYPTLLQLYLRRLVARNGDEIRVGWISLWNPRRVEWTSFRQADGVLVDEARQTREGRLFEWFTAGQNAAAVDSRPGAAVVEIDDLRFGFPSEPRHGLWGIRVRFDGEGRVVPPVERVDRPLPRTPRALLLQIWRDTFLR